MATKHQSRDSDENEKGVPTFCAECGNELKEDARFCTKCGASTDEAPHVKTRIRIRHAQSGDRGDQASQPPPRSARAVDSVRPSRWSQTSLTRRFGCTPKSRYRRWKPSSKHPQRDAVGSSASDDAEEPTPRPQGDPQHILQLAEILSMENPAGIPAFLEGQGPYGTQREPRSGASPAAALSGDAPLPTLPLRRTERRRRERRAAKLPEAFRPRIGR